MQISDKSRQKFGEALAKGVSALTKRGVDESWLTEADCLSGHVRITEALSGGPSAANYFAKQIEAISPAITRVTTRPVSLGEPATYDVDISFDQSIVESLYSDGKNSVTTIEKDGKTYVVDDEGNATEVDDPDKYVSNLNKTTGSRYQKQAEGAEGDVLADLQKLVEDANAALDGVGAEVALNDGKILISGDVALIKPTQQALPEPVFGLEDLEGGYNADTGAVEVVIPKFADARDVTNLEEFLYKAVNMILDAVESGDYNQETDWSKLLGDAEADPSLVTRYAYSGESFVGESKAKQAQLVKSLMVENFDEAVKVAKRFMGEKVAEAMTTTKILMGENFSDTMKVARGLMGEKIAESIKPKEGLDEEALILDRIHESVTAAVPRRMSASDSSQIND